MEAFSKYIKEECRSQGFCDCCISNAEELPQDKDAYLDWISQGFHGKMKFLENNIDLRFDPTLLFPGTKSIISVLLNYYPENKMPIANNYRIAKYAYGKDYHFIIKDKLEAVAQKCIQKFGEFNYRAFTDSAPILDRYWAKKGGLGWIGKNTLLIHPTHGSFFFIGHLFIDIQLEADNKFVEDLCLDCDKCIKSCPTQAIYEPYKMNASKCLSYQTIENKSPEKDIAPDKFRNWIYGCDICQDVCPFNKTPEANQIKDFAPHPKLFQLTKTEWKNLKPMEFGELFKGSAAKRAGYKGLMQNIRWIEKKQKE